MAKMFAELPIAIQKELQRALQRVGEILTEVNRNLAEVDPDLAELYGTVAASIYYNDPNVQGEFPSISVFLPEEAPYEELSDPAVVVPTDVSIFPNPEVITLMSTYLSSGSTEGDCCNKRKRCERVALGTGKGYCLKCKADRTCRDEFK